MDVIVLGQETEQEEMTGNTCLWPCAQPSTWFSHRETPHEEKIAHLVKGRQVWSPLLLALQ